MVIANVQLADAGFYRVKVSNSEGQAYIGSVKVTVLTATVSPSSLMLLEGESGAFSVTVADATSQLSY